MNINDIPLPPPLISSAASIIKPLQHNILKINISEEKHVSTVNRVPQSTRRYINNKLPVGMIKRPASSQLFDSLNHHHRELFLPPSIKTGNTTSKFNPILTKSKIQKCETDNILDKKVKSYNKHKERKRRGSEISEKEIKHQKRDHRSKNYVKPTTPIQIQVTPPVYLKSQVVVKKKLETQKICEESQKNHHNTYEHAKSKPQRSHDHYKFCALESKVVLKNKPSKTDIISNKHVKKLKRKKSQSSTNLSLFSSFTSTNTSSTSSSSSSSTSSSSSSSSTSSSENDMDCGSVDLPLVSPRSPEEDRNSVRKFPNSSCENVAETTRLANDYLKQLSETLLRVNQAYQNAYSKIPNEIINQHNIIDLENIPLPLEQNHSHAGIVHINVVGPKTPKMSNDVSKNDLMIMTNHIEETIIIPKSITIEKPENPTKLCSNSINVDNLSHNSNSSFGSKNVKSPYYSVNVSSHSKESERSEMKTRVLVPKISIFTIDYKRIDGILSKELFFSNHSRYFMDSMKCCCTMPNPDEWNEGRRSCGNGFNCILAQLKIECDNKLCPTESLCCNTQFSDLEKSIHKMYNIEFFFDAHQSIPWKLRAKKPIEKRKLIFEVAGDAEPCSDSVIGPTKSVDNGSILITPNIKIRTKRDTHNFLYYLSHVCEPDRANVNIEKWIVNGNVRVGLFSVTDLQPGDELVVFHPAANPLKVFYSQPRTITNEADAVACVQYLLHEPVPCCKSLISVVESLLDSGPDCDLLASFGDYGGLAVLCKLCDTFFQDDDAFPSDLFEKLIDLMTSVPYQNRKHTDVIGFDLSNFVNRLLDRMSNLTSFTYHHLIDKLKSTRDLLSMTAGTNHQDPFTVKTESKSLKKTNVSSNFDILHCRLPPYWCSKECLYGEEFRVFFFHRITKSMQWEMPVYPWEANDDNEIDIYDYNMASVIQVTHDEIQQMYNHLNKVYENKQKKILAQGNVIKRKKDTNDVQRKEIFKKRITELIRNLLKPYRSLCCTEGKIESDDDLNYLTNKLSQTILYKELKILNDKVDNLEVNPQVEGKTKAYVRTYMKSRGIVYKRPIRNSANDQKTKPPKTNLNS